MAIQNLDFGTAAANDGETPYTAWPKVQANFEDLYSSVAAIAAYTLDDLTGVVLTAPTNGQVLKYNGTNWVNGTDSTGGGGGSALVSVKDAYGAVGDGVTDDTAAFQALIDDDVAGYIPEGVYVVTELTATDLSLFLVGAGEEKSILKFTTADGFTVDTSNQSDRVVLRDLTITTTQTGGTAVNMLRDVPLNFFRPEQVLIENVGIRGWSYNTNWFSFGIVGENVRNGTIANCKIYGAWASPNKGDKGIYFTGQSINIIHRENNVLGFQTAFAADGDSEGMQYISNQCALGYVGASVVGSGSKPQAVFIGNHFNTFERGIVCNFTQCYIAGNLLYSASQGGSFSAPSDYAGIVLDATAGAVTQVQITDNQIIGLQAITENGIVTIGTLSGIKATNNQFVSLTGTGITLSSGTGLSEFIFNGYSGTATPWSSSGTTNVRIERASGTGNAEILADDGTVRASFGSSGPTFAGGIGVNVAAATSGGILLNRAADNPFVSLYNNGTQVAQLRASGANGVIGLTSDTGGTYHAGVKLSSGHFGIGALGSGTGTPDRRLHVEEDNATNNAVTQVARLTHTTSGTPAAGIGVGLEFEVETSANNNEVGATIEAVTTDVTSTSEDFDLVFSTMAAGATAAKRMRLPSTGGIALPDTNASHDLVIKPGSDLTAERTLTLTSGDANRTLDISAADVTISSTAATVLDDTSTRAMCATLGTWKVLAASAVAFSHTGNTSETTAATVTIPAGAMGANGILRITALWSGTSNANNKTYVMRLGGTSGSIIRQTTQTTNSTIEDQVQIANRNSQSSQVEFVSNSNVAGFGVSSGAVSTFTVDTSIAQDLVLRVQLANSADTIALESYSVEIFYAA